jgi:DNA-binding transcriptional LysR family regulator
MNFDQLTYFCAAAVSNNYVVAAEQLAVSPSWISKQMVALENELGLSLFLRSAHGVKLTPEGIKFLEFAQWSIRNYEATMDALAIYTKGIHEQIRLGSLPFVNEYHLADVIADFQVAHSAIDIKLTERNQEELLQKLKLHQLDLALLRGAYLSADEYSWVVLFDDELALCCSKTHPFATRTSIGLRDLKHETFISLEQESALPQLFADACHKEDIYPNVSIEYKRHGPVLSAVGRGLGVAIMPREQAGSDPFYGKNICCVPLETRIPIPVVVAYRNDTPLNGAAQTFLAYLSEVYTSR